jgi:hypothetical protein
MRVGAAGPVPKCWQLPCGALALVARRPWRSVSSLENHQEPFTRMIPSCWVLHVRFSGAAACTDTGRLAKRAVLNGRRAEESPELQGVLAWCFR